MSSRLALRLQDIPGVASVRVDLDSPGAESIRVAVAPGADQETVLEQVNALLVAYGVRQEPFLSELAGRRRLEAPDLKVEIRITPIKGGARIEVFGEKIRSFRVVPPNPIALAQGLADAWCQVIGRIPVEVVNVRREPGQLLAVDASDGVVERTGRSSIGGGWVKALGVAVGGAIGAIEGV